MDRAVDHTKSQARHALGLSAILTLLVTLMLIDARTALAAAPDPTVTLSPTSGPPGTHVTVTGRDWPAGHSVAIAFPDRGFWGPGSITVGPNGSFAFSFDWPSPAAPGDHQVAVIDNTGPVNAPPYPIFTVTSGSGAAPMQPAPTPTVTVGKTYVANSNWSEESQFNRGDLVRYQIVVSANGNATINAQMQVVDQNGRAIFNGRGALAVSPKAGSVFFQSTVPADARLGSYTEKATVTYNGATTTRTSTFTVGSGGAIAPPASPAQIVQLTGEFWEVVSTFNTVCDLLECKEVPVDVGKSVSAIDHLVTIGSLANAGREAKVVGDDLSALLRVTKGHTSGTPPSPKVHDLAIKTWNDTRELHLTLVGLVPGLEQFFPVPPPK